jgi:hypothetical protein
VANQSDKLSRAVLPIPDRQHVGLTTYDAKDPDTKFPPIEPLRPPEGMVRISLDGGVVPDHHGMAGPELTFGENDVAATMKVRNPPQDRRGLKGSRT